MEMCLWVHKSPRMTAGSVTGLVMSVEGPTVVAIVRASMPEANGVIAAACPVRYTHEHPSQWQASHEGKTLRLNRTHRMTRDIAFDQATLTVQLFANGNTLNRYRRQIPGRPKERDQLIPDWTGTDGQQRPGTQKPSFVWRSNLR